MRMCLTFVRVEGIRQVDHKLLTFQEETFLPHLLHSRYYDVRELCKRDIGKHMQGRTYSFSDFLKRKNIGRTRKRLHGKKLRNSLLQKNKY